ncbi:radical SAM protein [Dactylosporangium fulvum]|uniref:Radical SAM core domain-containing protein n=1 Tax=Dactylosporangium fulvum TaxID=53359 RepID=A0ABY5WAC5_9ACTN|nr:hypothetical protein [Dactylosporangium fulvum]UWP86502.1 hypothetical protein Dfulv_20570 [Dactylosporangium fulvum]
MQEAANIRRQFHGNSLELHSVIYPIDYCTSGCTYCGLSAIIPKGAHTVRGAMPPADFAWLMGELQRQGYGVHELVFGTVSEDQGRLASRVARWVERARALAPDAYLIVNCDTLREDGYRTLKSAGADAVWTFMEVMTPQLYSDKHRYGLKSDQPQRKEAPQRARAAGLAVGNALLWGLVTDWRAELEQFVVWAHEVGGFDFVATPVHRTVTVTPGSVVSPLMELTPPLNVDEPLYLEIIARLRIAFAEAHLVGNTRLDPGFVYGHASEIVDMCNGYVYAGSREHPSEGLAGAGHIATNGVQMDFFNPGAKLGDIQWLCPPTIRVGSSLPRTP